MIDGKKDIEDQKKAEAKQSNDSEPEYVKKEKTTKYFIKDGFFTAIKGGVTESYIMPLAIAMNATSGMLAILASVPDLFSSFFQLFSQESLKLFKTRKRLLVMTAFIQSLMWIPLIFIPFIKTNVIILVLLFVTLEKIIGTFQGPIFNSLMGDIISEDKRGEFFGKRNSVVNLINFVSVIVAGLVLSYFKNFDKNGTAHYVFFGFAILFAIAFITRSIAAYYKSKVYDPSFTPPANHISFVKFIKSMTHDNYGIFVLYVFLFKFAVSLSAPFFALYLLRDLQLNYVYFTIVLGASIVASFMAMSFWGKQIDKHGSKRVLTISGFLVPLSPLLMIVAIFFHNPLYAFIYLFIEEVYSGVVWAGFNLSTSSFLFDATAKHERIKYIAYYNFLVGVAVFLGAIIGGFLISIYPVWIVSSLPFIYITTGLLRLLVTSTMIKKVREARMVEVDFSGRGFFHHVVSISPHFGSTVEIVGVYHEPKHRSFHDVIRLKRAPVDPVKPAERKLYEKKSFEYYKENALKTLNQKTREPGQRDDSATIEKNLETDKSKISDITEKIKKDQLKK
jgi:MFS family permease